MRQEAKEEMFCRFIDGDIEAEAAGKIRALFDLLLEALDTDQNDWRDRVMKTIGVTLEDL